MTLLMTVCETEKFHSGEQMWFWFIFSKSVQSELMHSRGTPTRRPCELLDVETLITKLYLCGKLTDEQLNVMKKYGDRRRAPCQHVWSENRAAALWKSAMDVLECAAYKRGWIE